ncbi:MAG: GNAT family N-acetyltransferase [Actinobacteria bacterium]|nr:GNAT family N-acetyltransferase [Actinomycetota bacterium]
MIRAIAPADRAAWQRLFTDYGVFYETQFTDDVIAAVWKLLLESGSGVDALVAEQEGTVVGFAHYRSHPDTFTGGRDWFLDDLYVDPDARGAGHATALIEHLADLARAAGPAGTLRWITAADNERAQRVYDRIATKTTWVTYEKSL